jgi:hypothetical protein
MKRNELVDRLVKEGLSEKTLSKLTDNQLNILGSRMLSEQMKKGDVVVPTNTDPGKIKQLTAQGMDVALVNKPATEGEVSEQLKGGQKKLDKNHNGKIDGQDFKILQGQKKKKEDMKEADMGLTVKAPKSSGSVFGTSVKTKSSTSPKKKKTSKKADEIDESLHGIMIGATKEKLKKDLGRDPEDHEVEKELGKFVADWKKEKGETEKKSDSKKKEVDELLRFYDDDGNPIKDKKGKQDAVSTKDKDFEKKTKSKKCPDCGEYEKDCKCDHKHMDESKPSAGLSKEKKSEVVKKAKSGGDIGKKGKGFEKLADKAAKEYGSKEKGEKVAAASMWKNIKRESVEKKSWVKNLVENEFFHNFTSKGEIMELIQSKLNENQTMVQHGPKVRKGHNGIPEFMSYDALTAAEPKTAPSKPKTSPGTKPSPDKAPSPKHPYAPGPAEKPAPKAQMGEQDAPVQDPKIKEKPKKQDTPQHPYRDNPGKKDKPERKA